jgi:hypothetical protein
MAGRESRPRNRPGNGDREGEVHKSRTHKIVTFLVVNELCTLPHKSATVATAMLIHTSNSPLPSNPALCELGLECNHIVTILDTLRY